jgi:hypothetical protein
MVPRPRRRRQGREETPTASAEEPPTRNAVVPPLTIEDGLTATYRSGEEEIRICLALLGVTGYGQLDTSYLHEGRLVTDPGALSAFPLL